ncbi:MAG: efflux RND transporter periplasmic adaptor subunit [Candidatus Zixiibacteriota bacterium]|nr:MAG: efflux RND transporter periplasmic adaptor subunit [candidate division Zixibacteria bacterium]
MRRLIIIPILIVVSAILVFLIYQRQKANVLPPDVIFSSGSVEANTVTVSAQTGGKVLAKRFRKGDEVKEGDTLLVIERDLLDSKMDELETGITATMAEMDAARIDLANVKKNLDRLKQAYTAGSIPQKDMDNLTASFQSGGKRISALESKLQTLNAQKATLAIQIGYTTVTSPIGGYIQSDPVEIGEIVMMGSALFEIVNLKDTWVEIYINETEIPFVHLSDTADVYLDSDPQTALKGTVSYISQKAEFTPKNVQTKKERVKQVFAVRVRVDNSSQRFKPGLPVDVYLKKR